MVLIQNCPELNGGQGPLRHQLDRAAVVLAEDARAGAVE
jgi:hypothetical protein